MSKTLNIQMFTKGQFNHSVSVPRIYKVASKVAKNAKTGLSLKNLVYQEKHVNIKAVYALVVETFKREAVIEDLIGKSKLFEKEPRFDPWLAKILICEMLWGKNKMKGDSKPVKTILEYEKLLKNFLSNCADIKRDVLKHNIMKPRYTRVNTLKISVEEAVNNFRDEGWTLVKYFNDSDYDGYLEKLNNLESNEFMIDIHIPELLIFPPKTEFYNHEAYKSKMIILQDKASCLPVFLLNPIPGCTVIDMCAAPGMKTTQVAAMLNNSGTVHAVELDKNREKILRELVEAAGAICVKTVLKDVMQISESDCPGVEYILVDPSCTGSGITDRVEIEDQNFHDRMSRLKKLCNFQAKLLRHATTAFPQAKRIVYSTCSINAEENEDVVRQVLETCRNFKLVDAKKLLKSWNGKSSEVFPALGKMCVYATPEKDKTNGFFIAVLERLEEGEKNPYLNVQLCKLYDRGKKTKNLNRKENGDENLTDQNSKKVNLHQTNLAITDVNVPLQKRRFKKENNFTNADYLHTESDKIDNTSESHVLSDQLKKNKLQQNVLEQDNTKMLKELDKGIADDNEKIKKKKRMKIAPDDTETLENGRLEGNHKNQYNETIKDENKKSLIDCSQTKNSKSKKKNQMQLDNENLILTNEDCENVKLKERKRKHIDKISGNGLENEQTLIINSLTEEISHKKKKKKHLNENENQNITSQNSEDMELKTNKKRKQSNVLSVESGNEFENYESQMNKSTTEGIYMKKKKTKYVVDGNLTIEECKSEKLNDTIKKKEKSYINVEHLNENKNHKAKPNNSTIIYSKVDKVKPLKSKVDESINSTGMEDCKNFEVKKQKYKKQDDSVNLEFVNDMEHVETEDIQSKRRGKKRSKTENIDITSDDCNNATLKKSKKKKKQNDITDE